MDRKYRCIPVVVLMLLLTSAVHAQESGLPAGRSAESLTGIWEIVFENGESMRLELLQRSDSLYGYEVNGAEMIPLLGTCSKEGQLYLRRPDPSTPTADADEQAGSLSPLVHEITGTVQHNCTSFKGVKQVRDQESGAVLDQKAFAAAKRIYTDLPSWMNRGMNAVILLEEAVPDMDKVPDR